MKPEIAEAITRAWPELEKLGVEHIDVFGSEARGDASSSSDVDVLVKLRVPSLRVLVEVRDRLTVALGRRVDVLTPGALEGRPGLRERVLREAIRVA
jgi:predicted nucleotidyltransferase